MLIDHDAGRLDHAKGLEERAELLLVVVLRNALDENGPPVFALGLIDNGSWFGACRSCVVVAVVFGLHFLGATSAYIGHRMVLLLFFLLLFLVFLFVFVGPAVAVVLTTLQLKEKQPSATQRDKCVCVCRCRLLCLLCQSL